MSTGRRINPWDPFGPFASQPAAKMVKELLLGEQVQGIRFAFGSVLVWPEGFRAVADHIHDSAGIPGLRVVIDATRFIALFRSGKPTFAQYTASEDAIYLPSHNLLEGALGLGIVVHECVHALCDLRGRSTALRSEEGAAQVAQAWYYLTRGVEGEVGVHLADEVIEITAAVRGRAARAPGVVGLGPSEINKVRAVTARQGYANVHNTNRDGIAGATV
jgi:hypothetical protein